MVFLDIGLPGMNGYEVARRLRAYPATATTKLIALTGWGTEDDIRKSKMAGFHAHLTKPVDPEAVGAMLARSLGGRRCVGCKVSAAVYFSPLVCQISRYSAAKASKTILAGATFRFDAFCRPDS